MTSPVTLLVELSAKVPDGLRGDATKLAVTLHERMPTPEKAGIRSSPRVESPCHFTQFVAMKNESSGSNEAQYETP